MHRGTVTAIAACAGHVLAGLLAAAAGVHLWDFSAVSALVLGLAVTMTMVLTHLTIVTARDHGKIMDAISEHEEEVEQVEQRLLGLERSLKTLLRDMETDSGRNVSDLATELNLLRTVMDKMAGSVTALRPAADATLAGSAVAAHPPVSGEIQHTAKAARETLAVLRSALQESRVDLYLQPIVRLPSRRIAHYETFSRLRDENGELLMPGDYMPAAQQAGLAAPLDNLLLFRSINLIRRLGPRRPGVRLFCNISGASLADESFLKELVSFMRLHPELAERLVFELDAMDARRLSDAMRQHLSALARLGFAFSVDNVVDLKTLQPERLAAMNVQYVKVDVEVFLNSPTSVARGDLKGYLERFDIELIVTRIESDRAVAEVLELGAAYGQGFVFGEPRLSRSENYHAGETAAA